MSASQTYGKALEGFNQNDPKAYAAAYAPHTAVSDPLYPQPLKGRDAIEQDVVDVRRALPDARLTFHGILEIGKDVALEYTLSGTHLGPMATPDGEIPATRRTLRVDGAVFSRLDERGDIIEERRYYDVAGMLAQLGLS